MTSCLYLHMHIRDSRKRKLKRLTRPKNRMKNKELQIPTDNVSTLMAGKYFSPEKLLHKTIFFDVSRVDEETHFPGTTSFSLRREDEDLMVKAIYC